MKALSLAPRTDTEASVSLPRRRQDHAPLIRLCPLLGMTAHGQRHERAFRPGLWTGSHRVPDVIILGVFLVAIVAVIVLGYRRLASAVSSEAASGVLLMMVGVGATVWLFDNWTW